MRTTSFSESGKDFIATPIIAMEADYSKFDSAEDILRDAAKWGLLEELRDLICGEGRAENGSNMRIARDIAYEFAGEKDRDFSVDLFIHVTGIAEFGRQACVTMQASMRAATSGFASRWKPCGSASICRHCLCRY
jgi:hypothetical protein